MESNPKSENTADRNSSDNWTSEDCAVCLQRCVQPIKLSCNHIFCFLCIKGITLNHQKYSCPICRHTITLKDLSNPDLLCTSNNARTALKRALSKEEDEYHWFYSGANGWWEYDERTTEDIDKAYSIFTSSKDKGSPKPKRKKKNSKQKNVDNSDCSTFEIMIAGAIYIIDFKNMIQHRKGFPMKKRQIRKEIRGYVVNCKGVAGLQNNTQLSDSNLAAVQDDQGDTKPSNVQVTAFNRQRLPAKADDES